MPEWLHQTLMVIHIASGMVAIAAGGFAVAARKGGSAHSSAGSWFVAAMLMLGVSAAILEPFRTPTPGSPLVGVFVCYFVLTSWITARHRDGKTGKFELAAGIVALAFAAAILWGGTSEDATPVGRGPIFIAAGLSTLAGLSDVRSYLRKKLTPAQRLSRHLWRMCFAFFIATGSFFLGQQDVLPAPVRGSPILFVLALAPLAVMAIWLFRVRGKQFGRLIERSARGSPTAPTPYRLPPAPARDNRACSEAPGSRGG